LWEGDWELIDGTAYAMAPSPGFEHQSIAMLIGSTLTESIKSCKNCIAVMEMDYKISDDTILRPDIALVCGQKDGAYIKTAPKLIVEVVSPSSALRDEKIKLSLYEEERVPYYILIYPKDLRAKIYSLQNSSYQKVADILKGSFKFDDSECGSSIDFDFVFERFR
jgi:Uma2 family endonuclease